MQSCEEESARSRKPSQRRSAREQPTCILNVGGQQLPVAITEERGGTLHVLVQGNPQFWVKDPGQLTTPDAKFSVRIFNIVRVEAEDGDPMANIATFCIGLERMGDIERRSNGPVSDVNVIEPKKPATRAKGARWPIRGLFILAIIATVTVFSIAAWYYSPRIRAAFHFPATGEATDDNVSGSPRRDSPPDSAAARAPTKTFSELLRLPGAESFVQPEVAKRLELTPNQTEACQRINRITQQAIEDLEKYWGGSGRWELARKRSVLQDEARHQALLLLTDAQRKLLDDAPQ